jgi:hypothetical protein
MAFKIEKGVDYPARLRPAVVHPLTLRAGAGAPARPGQPSPVTEVITLAGTPKCSRCMTVTWRAW